ncbi:MAG: NADH-quinone oxidoreductase subunit N [Candidatus Marinimicrobia bacterium]|nr:NADH-quinone oxidoreductase subunit N [Candidatus Neomarinimicrobiota bacterium]MCF7830256.1 NADH-quinone oxidoreductase subunit N [Candidatus Neomarinimicrobiota bacterium]MCF7882283.1 NADH-quinone oxidoreductase subunit N [Candidatus Neomarinimicrobiota bacterium]
MTGSEFTGLLPIIVVAVSAIVVLLQVAIKRNHFLSLLLTLAGMLGSFLTIPMARALSPIQVSSLIRIDDFALFFIGLTLAASAVVAMLTYNYMKERDENREEYFIVLLLAVLGANVLVAATHFVSLFLGLEILTVSLYVMIAYLRESNLPLEAGLKYLILAAASSAFLLFGMALVYAELGAMEFSVIGTRLAETGGFRSVFILTGFGLILTGAGFKLAVVPFHMWTPDVYEGAPAPVTAFVATVSKGGMLAVLLRYFVTTNGYEYQSVIVAVSIIAVLSMFTGNFLALLQRNVKRLLAYSSISHLGYILVAFIAGGAMALDAIAYYLVVYFATTLGAFGIISLLSEGGDERVSIDDYRGLFWTRPWLAAGFTLMMFSLAGIPLTAGFIGKYFVVTAGVGSALWGLVLVLAVNSAIGLYYYLRVVVAMLSSSSSSEDLPAMSYGGRIIFGVLSIAILYFGIYPAPLAELIHKMMQSLG